MVSQADQTGTVAEILVEDGKPVSVDVVSSLFPALVHVADMVTDSVLTSVSRCAAALCHCTVNLTRHMALFSTWLRTPRSSSLQ